MRRRINAELRSRRVLFAYVGLVLVWMLAWQVLVQDARGQAQEKLQVKDYVSDFASVLSPTARAQIDALCTELDQKAQAQIAVVTVKTLDGQPIEQYSIDLATRLGVGPKQSSRGVLILVAVNDHQYRIEVGYGLEPILPDGKTGDIGREAVPYLRQNNYDAALLLMTRRVADVIAADRGVKLTGVSPPAPAVANGNGKELPPAAEIFLLIFVIFIVFSFLRRSGGGGRYGGGGWGVGPMVGGPWGGGFGGGGGGGGGEADLGALEVDRSEVAERAGAGDGQGFSDARRLAARMAARRLVAWKRDSTNSSNG